MKLLKLVMFVILLGSASAIADGGPIPMCDPAKNCDKGTGKPVPQPGTCPHGSTCT